MMDDCSRDKSPSPAATHGVDSSICVNPGCCAWNPPNDILAVRCM